MKDTAEMNRTILKFYLYFCLQFVYNRVKGKEEPAAAGRRDDKI